MLTKGRGLAMRKLLAGLVAAAALAVPASATALTHRQIADQHAASHCALVHCFAYNLTHIDYWMGGEQYFYQMWWTGYGYTCHWRIEPDVFVSNTLPVTEHNWDDGNVACY